MNSIYARLFVVFSWIYLLSGCSDSTTTTPPDARAVTSLNENAARFFADAETAWQNDDLSLVLNLADSAISYQPEHPAPYFLKGQVLHRMNRIQEAEAAFHETLTKDPVFQAAWLSLGNLAFSSRKYSRAIEMYQRESQVLEAMKERYGVSFTPAYQEAISEVFVQQGRAQRQLGQDDAALTAFRAAIASDSTNAAAYADLSQSLNDTGLFDEAFAAAQRALQLAPGHPDYHFMIGSLLLEQEEAAQAIPHLQQTLRQKPWMSSAMYRLGMALVQTNQMETGQEVLAVADSLQKLNAAIDKARFNAQNYPDSPNQWLNLARLLIEAGRLEEAEEPFSIARSLQPGNLAISNDMANLALVRGDTTEAINRLERLLTQHPNFADGWFNLGVIAAMRENDNAARQAWQRTLAIDASHPLAAQYLERLN